MKKTARYIEAVVNHISNTRDNRRSAFQIYETIRDRKITEDEICSLIEKMLWIAGDTNTFEEWNGLLNLYSDKFGEEPEDLLEQYKNVVENQTDLELGEISIWDIRERVNNQSKQTQKANAIASLEQKCGRILSEKELINIMVELMLSIGDNYRDIIQLFKLL